MCVFFRLFIPLVSTNMVSWTVVGGPNPAWAETVFGKPGMDRRWQEVGMAVRLAEDEAGEAVTGARRERGPGTDLTVGLSPSAHWVSGAMANADGVEFVANMPTEEVFTSPDWRRADGRLTTTAPFFLVAVNTLVDGLKLEFSDGSIRAASAER